MPLIFDDEIDAPPTTGGRLVFDDEEQQGRRLVFDDEQPASITRQSPFETGVRSLAMEPGRSLASYVSGAGRVRQQISDIIGQNSPDFLGGLPQKAFDAATIVPRTLAPYATDIAEVQSQAFYAPDSTLNPKAAAVGSGLGQAPGMIVATALAGPAGPIALGAAQGADQGIAQAEEMGITSPAKKLALGGAYAGIEMATNKLGGFGSHALTAPVKRTLGQAFKAGVKTIASEAIEEPIAGIAQDATAVAFAPDSYETNQLRPFVMTPQGVPVLNMDYLQRRQLETIGGAAGGIAGAGFQALHNRAQPAAPAPAAVPDPLAAHAATMPEPVPAPVAADTQTWQPPEGDLITDFNIPHVPDIPNTEPVPRTNQAPANDAPPGSSAAAPQAGIQQAPRGFDAGATADGLTPPIYQQASVTGKAQQGSSSSAPVEAAAHEADAGSSPAAGASTYTGPAFGSTAPTTTRQTPVIPDAPYGGRDVLDFVNDNTIAVPPEILEVINERKNAQLPASKTGDFNWLKKYGVPKAFRKYLFSESTGQTSNINEVAMLAFDENLISDPTPDALMAEILNTIDSRESYTRETKAREKLLAEQEKAAIAAEKKFQKEQKANGGVHPDNIPFSRGLAPRDLPPPAPIEHTTPEPIANESPLADSLDHAAEVPSHMRAHVWNALAGFEKVWNFTAPKIKRLGLRLLNARSQHHGEYEPGSHISLHPERSDDQSANSAVHEMVHHLHLENTPGVDFDTEAHAPLKTLMRALNGTQAARALARAVRRNVGKNNRLAKWLRYAASPEEVLARGIERATAKLAGRTPPNYGRLDKLTKLTDDEIDAIIPHVRAYLKSIAGTELPGVGQPAGGADAQSGGTSGGNAGGSAAGVALGPNGHPAGQDTNGTGVQVEDDWPADLPPFMRRRAPSAPSPEDDIHLTHEAERARMEAEGKEALPTGGQGTVEEWQAQAAAAVQQPGAAGALVTDILKQQRPASPVEHYMLMNYAAALDAQIAGADATLADPAADPAARTAAAEQKRTLDAERDRVAVAAQIAGSKAGAALGARSRGLERGQVPSLDRMIADITLIQDPTGRTPLTPEDRKVIETTHEKMTQAEAAFIRNDEQGSQSELHTELAKLLKEAQDEVAAQKEIIETQRGILADKGATVKLYTRSKAKLKSWADQGDAAMQRLRDKGFFAQANMGIDPSVILDLATVVRGWMSKGALNTADLTARMITTLGEKNFMQVKKFLPQIFDKASQLARDDAKTKTSAEVLAKGRAAAARNDGKLPRTLARQLALAHIVDHLKRGDKTLSAGKIAELVRADLEEFQPGITTREARDLISGYGHATFPSKDEARASLRDLAAQMQKITQIEALKKRERLLKSGPQRDKPSAELRELQKQVEQLKKETGYESRSREDELKSARDRIKTSLENQIEELQRVLDGKATPNTPREAVAYDAELNALKTLRNSLKELVAEMPEHKLASEARRNKAALKAAQASEAEWNRRAKSKEWTRPGNKPANHSQDVLDAKAKAKQARANFEALKKAADPRNDPDTKALREFKSRTQSQINAINGKIARGEFNPPKKTPRQIKHDAESEQLAHKLRMERQRWSELRLKHKWKIMGIAGKGVEIARSSYRNFTSILTSLDLSAALRQGKLKLFSHPGRFLFNDVPAMWKAFLSPEGETGVLEGIRKRRNSISGRYKRSGLAIHDTDDYSALMAEGNARGKFADRIWLIGATNRAYTAMLNHMRADLFDHYAQQLENGGQLMTPTEETALADRVNNLTGSGRTGIRLSGANMDLLGAFFFSPKFIASRFHMAAGTDLWRPGTTNRVRKIAAAGNLKIIAGYAALYAALSGIFGSDDDRWKLRSGGFGKVSASPRTSIDPTAGLSPMITFMARQFTGKTISAHGQTVDTLGKNKPFSGKSWWDITGRFIRSKASPGLGKAIDLGTGETFMGEDTYTRENLLKTFLPIPMAAQSVWDLSQTEKPALAIPLSAASLLGESIQTRPPKR